MRKYVVLAAMAALAVAAQAQTFESASEAVGNMKVGWNLGNTLDSNSGDVNNMWIEQWSQRRPQDYETAWGQPVTTRELIHMFKEAGFGVIRVPVTWYPHIGSLNVKSGKWDQADWTGNDVDPAWMARVREVVDYVIDEGMYCVLNVHHDTGAGSTHWLLAGMDEFAAAQERYEALWSQIATEFADYDHHLLFEAYNEMLDPIDSWCFASFSNGYDAAIAASAYAAINSYAQSFVDVVRASGGNNAQRNLIVNTYGASCGSGNWSSHLQDPLKEMALPSDPAPGHLLFEVHSYPNTENLSNAKYDFDDVVRQCNTHLVSKGAPLVLGEWGTSGKTETAAQRSNYVQFAKYCIQKCKENGIVPIHWMGLIDGPDRADLKWTDPELRDAILKGWYGDDYDPASAPAIVVDEAETPYYNLMGMPMARPTTPGIYIHNGKKVLVP